MKAKMIEAGLPSEVYDPLLPVEAAKEGEAKPDVGAAPAPEAANNKK